MCTKPRIVAPDLIYEISSRGAMGTNIFSSNELKTLFLKELAYTLKKFSFQCYAWNVMDDHYHILVKSSDVSVSTFMQRINSIYAKQFNKITNGSGVVFHKRFASAVIEDTELKKLIRYIHLNPIRCGKCNLDQLANYQWCGHGIILNRQSNHFQNIEDVLKMFSGSDPTNTYNAYIRDKSADNKNDLIINQVRMANHGVESFSKSTPWILGCAEFVKSVLEKDHCRRLRIARFIRENITLERIQLTIEDYLKLPSGSLYRQSKLNQQATARCLFSYIGKFRYDFSIVKISNYLNVSCSAISKMITRYLKLPQRITTIEELFIDLNKQQNLNAAISVG